MSRPTASTVVYPRPVDKVVRERGVRMSEEEKQKNANLHGAGVILGSGLGAAVGVAMGDVLTGTWIGALIGLGLALLYSAIR